MKQTIRYKAAAVLIVLSLFLVSAHCNAEQTETGLYRDSVNEPSKGGGKRFMMSFTELERQPHYSIVKVEYVSGSSVGSALYFVKGCWEIARQRNMEYFINLKEWTDADGNFLMKIGFTNDTSVDMRSYYGDYDSTKDLRYLSVSDYAPLWEKMYPRR